MCLSTVYLRANDREVRIMKDVVRMESDNGGFVLTGLLGEQKFLQGTVKRIDFADEHITVIAQD